MLNVKQVARALRISEKSVYRRLRSGEWEAVKIGGLWRIPASTLTRIAGTG